MLKFLRLGTGYTYCTSGESSSSAETLTERWEDQRSILTSISSSLKEGPIREDHLTQLRDVGRDLACDEIPDLRWVITEAAAARSSENGGSDPAHQQVQSLLGKLDVVADVTRCLRHEDQGGTSFLQHLSAPRNRNSPEEGEARAAELNEVLENQIIPAVSEVIAGYQELVRSTADVNTDSDSTADAGADSTVGSSDSDGDGPFD